MMDVMALIAMTCLALGGGGRAQGGHMVGQATLGLYGVFFVLPDVTGLNYGSVKLL